ncbi:MAG: BON domain-containing protein [Aeromicrobium sp.]|nr:BON domain-containing protein [Burkholderiales bacterium]
MNTPQKFYRGVQAPSHPPQVAAIALIVVLASSLLAGCNNKSDTSGATTNSKIATTTVGTEIDDTVITTKVKAALLGNQDVKGFGIKVETRKGVVQLSGFVDSQLAIDRAIAVARTVEGIKSVQGDMTIKEGKVTVGNEVDDSVVTARVKSALLADNQVKSFDIAVVTRKGSVQLSGFVDSQAQIDRAVDISTRTKDVKTVLNELKVKK